MILAKIVEALQKTDRYRSTRGPSSDTSDLDHRRDPRGFTRRMVASHSLHPSRNDEEAKVKVVTSEN